MFTVRGRGIDDIREFTFSFLKNFQGGTVPVPGRGDFTMRRSIVYPQVVSIMVADSK